MFLILWLIRGEDEADPVFTEGYLDLARSGGLIINPLLTTLVRSRWLNIGPLFAFLWTSAPSLSSHLGLTFGQ